MKLWAALATVASLGAASGVQAATLCATAPRLTPISDLRFGRLIVADRGGSAQVPADECAVSGTDGVVRLASLDAGCAEFDLEGGTANASRIVQLRLQTPRSFSFASGGGLAQVAQLSLSGGGAQGGGELYTVRLDAAGRAHLRVGARLRIVNFAPGELNAPISLSANYLGCPL